MARGAPDYTKRIEVHISAGQAAEEYAAGGAGKYSGTAQTYQTVEEWTVTTGRVGELKAIIIISDDYAKTHIKIVIGTVTWCEDWNPTSSMPIPFQDLRLDESVVTTVSAKSTDGTAIEVDAIIVAKEVG
jgi:hypothetical protein